MWPCSVLLAAAVMFRFCSGFVIVTQGGIERLAPISRVRRPLFSSIDFDGLMNEIILNRRGPLSTATSTNSSRSDGWRRIHWDVLSTMDDDQGKSTIGLTPPPSPVDVMTIGDRVIYMKRDDQLRLPGSQLSGNKVRMSALTFL